MRATVVAQDRQNQLLAVWAGVLRFVADACGCLHHSRIVAHRGDAFAQDMVTQRRIRDRWKHGKRVVLALRAQRERGHAKNPQQGKTGWFRYLLKQ